MLPLYVFIAELYNISVFSFLRFCYFLFWGLSISIRMYFDVYECVNVFMCVCVFVYTTARGV